MDSLLHLDSWCDLIRGVTLPVYDIPFFIEPKIYGKSETPTNNHVLWIVQDYVSKEEENQLEL